MVTYALVTITDNKAHITDLGSFQEISGKRNPDLEVEEKEGIRIELASNEAEQNTYLIPVEGKGDYFAIFLRKNEQFMDGARCETFDDALKVLIRYCCFYLFEDCLDDEEFFDTIVDEIKELPGYKEWLNQQSFTDTSFLRTYDRFADMDEIFMDITVKNF